MMARQKLSPQGQRLRTVILTVPIIVATSGSWRFLTRPFEAAHALTLDQLSSTNVSCSESLSVSSPALESATQTEKSSSFTRKSHPMTTASGSHRVYALWNRHRRAYVMYISIYLCRSTVGVLIIIYRRVGGMREAISTLWVGAGPPARLRYALG